MSKITKADKIGKWKNNKYTTENRKKLLHGKLLFQYPLIFEQILMFYDLAGFLCCKALCKDVLHYLV